MIFLRKFRVGEHELGLLFHRGELRSVLPPGNHWRWDLFGRYSMKTNSVLEPKVTGVNLDVLVRSGELEGLAKVVDLRDHERALVFVDKRFHSIVGPGLHVFWTVFRKVTIEVVDARSVRFTHPELPVIAKRAALHLAEVNVAPGHTGLFFRNGELVSRVGPGQHAFWTGLAHVFVEHVDLREQIQDVTGQEIMTHDKVTLRLNALVVFRVADPKLVVTAVDDWKQALHRETQLALREVVGARELDALLVQKDEVQAELTGIVRERVLPFGVEVKRLGIRDVILPGDMKVLLNRVTEARKVAEAALITRREETAAMRSQANTAKILAQNPTLMRLRELETLERVAGNATLNLVLGEQGMTDRVMKLI
ncbi:MAG: slipin family protein [Planctomycetota bacterium]|jgi:regulator of protease activity HflC (stomatin/prohibitin superfamily)